MKFSRERIFRVTIATVLLILAVYANLYTIRRMTHYGMELYLYDKLLVAYREGDGMPALRRELDRAAAQRNMPREAALAVEFKKNLDTIEAPEEFLEKRLEEDRNKLRLLRNLRILSFLLILALILLRLRVNLSGKAR